MRIAVLGTGVVGRTMAGRLAQLGHDVTIGTRDVAATLARGTTEDAATSFVAWAADHPDVRLAGFAEAAASSELVVNATAGTVSAAALNAAGAENLADKVVLDLTGPLDFSRGPEPRLFIDETESLAERLQAAFPRAKVVKTLNTMGVALMVDPASLAGGDHSVFVSGSDLEAKKTVTELLHTLGHTDVIDLGDLRTARATELLFPLWASLFEVLGTDRFNFKIVR